MCINYKEKGESREGKFPKFKTVAAARERRRAGWMDLAWTGEHLCVKLGGLIQALLFSGTHEIAFLKITLVMMTCICVCPCLLCLHVHFL